MMSTKRLQKHAWYIALWLVATFFTSFVSAETQNLAEGISATSSGSLYWPNVITDGDTWANSGSGSSGEFAYTSQYGLQYVKLDLGICCSVDKVVVWHYASDGRTYHNTKTQVSADGVDWYTVFDSATSVEYQETAAGRTHTFSAREVRYVRDYLNGSTANPGNHWVEIEVWGTTGPPPPPTQNLAEGISATSSGSLYWPNVITDGDTWANSGSGSSGEFAYTSQYGLQYVKLDLGICCSVDKVVVWHYASDGRFYHNTKTQVSADGVDWYTVFDSATSGEYQETAAGRTHTFSAREVRYVRDYLNGSTANPGNHWVEIEVWGTTGPPPPSQFALSNPANGATNLSVTPILSWEASSDATSYDVYYGTTSPGTLQTTVTTTDYTVPSALETHTTYYWKIVATNSSGETTATGAPWSFTTTSGGEPPGQITGVKAE